MDNNNFIVLKQGDNVFTNKYTKADLKGIVRKLQFFAIVANLAVILFAFLFIIPNFELAYTASSSMVPTLSVGDLTLYGAVKSPESLERGTIVLFNPVDDSGAGSLLTGSTYFLEKRLIGLPGETIRIEDGVVYINGQPLDEPYTVFSLDEESAISRTMDEITIPENCYFVMGDNRDKSADSRVFGVVPCENIRFSYIFSFQSISGWITGVNNDKYFLG